VAARELQFFSGRDTVDDLGIGTVRDAISNSLLSGHRSSKLALAAFSLSLGYFGGQSNSIRTTWSPRLGPAHRGGAAAW
jgi:hypothetical protein